MEEYIKKSEARHAVLHNEGQAVIAAIDDLKTFEPKEGEYIHGRELGKEWLYDHWVTYFEDWRCSNCGVVFEQESKPKYHYCPNCGARMRGEHDEQIH